MTTREANVRGDGASAAPALAPGLVARLADVRAAVTTYVGRRRAEGTPVQRVLPEIKALVREAVSGAEVRDAAELLVAQAVQWSITAYYAPDDAPDAAAHPAAPNVPPSAGRVPTRR